MRRVAENRVAAFFDLDGTILPTPSLEMRFVRILRDAGLIGLRNGLRWCGEALRLAPRGIQRIAYGNKMYLHGVRAAEVGCGELADPQKWLELDAARSADGFSRQAMAVAILRSCQRDFFPKALERMFWHAEREHSLVIVSGTLEPLAKLAALGLQIAFARRGMPASPQVCATRLEVADDKWTGRIVGEAVVGEAKGRAVRRFAALHGIELSGCFAYGDSVHDRWMLEAAGRPAAVNPSDDLARTARRNGWPIIRWQERNAQRQISPSAVSNAPSDWNITSAGQRF
jgi:HAD superfamily phosphoserine phosphatase-like hydrolase